MAVRYSGNVTITLTYNDKTSQYDCSVKAPKEKAVKVHVRPPPSSRLAVDSPEAYDGTARAAYSFADDEHGEIGNPEYGSGTGIIIHRKKPGKGK